MNRYANWILLIGLLFWSGCGFSKQSQIESYVADEKQNLPKTLFADVKVVDMASGDSEVIYFCNSKGMSNARVQRAQQQLQLKAENFVRKNKEALKRMIDNEVLMTFVGQNDEKDEVFRFTIKPWTL